MGKWIYTLKNGTSLRSAIDDGDLDQVLDCLADCFREILQALPDYYDDSDLESDLESIENARDNLEHYEEYDMSLSDVEEEVDSLLNDFYDLCDSYGIWVDT